MRAIIAAAIIAAALLTLPYGTSAFQVQPYIIDSDGGGLISSYVGHFRSLRNSHVPVVIRGACVSACTIVLSLPKSQVCVEKSALLGFHAASDMFGNISEEGTQDMIRRFYPKIVQVWIAQKPLTVEEIRYLTADEIVSLGIFRACESE